MAGPKPQGLKPVLVFDSRKRTDATPSALVRKVMKLEGRYPIRAAVIERWIDYFMDAQKGRV
ncbi:MAG TPA: hypothetical protein VNJ03_05290 [Vicinamibacterales bacterium]|nr:hypothetical protein [Vicinamibacterales bacterium]